MRQVRYKYLPILLLSAISIEVLKGGTSLSEENQALPKEQQTLSKERIVNPGIDYLKKIPEYGKYILGPGDIFSVIVAEETTLLNGPRFIDGNGVAALPRIGS